MKKILLLVISFFSVTIVMAQEHCDSALTVVLGNTTTAPSFANESGEAPTQLCGLTNQNGTPATKGKWYTFTATQNNTVTVSTLLPQNNNADTRVIVYSGSCANLTCVGANDDYNGTNSSQVTFPITTGTVYIIAFDNRYNQSGFDFTLTVAPPPAEDRLSFTSTLVNGIAGTFNNCIVDMNGDFKDDIVSAVNNTQMVIAFQQTDGSFVTQAFPLTNTVVQPAWSIAAGDYDNNGYNDLIYGSGSGIAFLKANEDGTAYTTDRKPQSYLVQRTNFVDIDNDGKLDAFACDDNAPNRRYMNDGTNMNHIQGGIGDFASGGNYASLWSDFNNDGKIDMHLSKCGQGGSGVGGNINQLFQNNGDGSYTNIADNANMADPEQTWSSAVGDFNNDGWMDVIVGVNSLSNGNTNVKKNNGDGTFTSVTTGSGYDLITSTGREFVAFDFDNDGFLDVLNAGNTIMFGDGDFHFTPNPNTYPLSTVDRPVGDLNDDGFLDIQNGGNVLFNNGNQNHWIKLHLQGVESNRNGIGARVELFGAWGKQIRDVQSGTGFQNMSTINTQFGIGAETNIDKIVIKWPSGTEDTILNPSSDQNLLVLEGSTLLAVNQIKNDTFTVFPNPVNDFINVKLYNPATVITNANIYDMNGKLILSPNFVNQTMDVKSLPTGAYVLILKDAEGNTYSHKIIKK
jgi:hypothetical protein